MIENLETTLRYGGVPAVPHRTGSSQAMPNFSNIQLPTPSAPTGSTMPSVSEVRTPSASFPSPAPPSSINVADIPPAVWPASVPGAPEAIGKLYYFCKSSQ